MFTFFLKFSPLLGSFPVVCHKNQSNRIIFSISQFLPRFSQMKITSAQESAMTTFFFREYSLPPPFPPSIRDCIYLLIFPILSKGTLSNFLIIEAYNGDCLKSQKNYRNLLKIFSKSKSKSKSFSPIMNGKILSSGICHHHFFFQGVLPTPPFPPNIRDYIYLLIFPISSIGTLSNFLIIEVYNGDCLKSQNDYSNLLEIEILSKSFSPIMIDKILSSEICHGHFFILGRTPYLPFSPNIRDYIYF
jgi:hypothetical protein